MTAIINVCNSGLNVELWWAILTTTLTEYIAIQAVVNEM
jgi:hypothetical protein